MSDKSATLDKYEDDNMLSTVLHYGLLIGAVFQLICICATILMPAASDSEMQEELKSGNDTTLTNARRLYKMRKQEKKKRR